MSIAMADSQELDKALPQIIAAARRERAGEPPEAIKVFRDLLEMDFCGCCQQERQVVEWRPDVWCMRCRRHVGRCVETESEQTWFPTTMYGTPPEAKYYEIVDEYAYGEWVPCSLCGGHGCQACSPAMFEDIKHPGGHRKPRKGTKKK